MPIVDKELVAETPLQLPEKLNVPVGLMIYESLQKNTIEQGDSLWMMDVSTGKSLSYRQLVAQIDLVAANLYQRGLRPHDMVLIMTSNHLESAVFFMAVWRAGGCVTCLSPSLLSGEIRSRAVEVGAKYVLTDMERGPRVLEAAKTLNSVKDVFVVGQLENCTSFDELLIETDFECPKDFQVDENSICWLLYSSGTTGKPKVIVHTHRNMNIVFQSSWARKQSKRKILFVNLITFFVGWNLIVSNSMGGGHLYTMSDYRDEYLPNAIDQIKPQTVSLYPFQLVYLCRHPTLDRFDLKSVTVIVCAGSNINPCYERDIYDKFPNLIRLVNRYGMTEVGLISTNMANPSEQADSNPTNAKSKHIVGSVGHLVPGNRLKIIDPETKEKLGPNQIGEICVQTPYMMKEYLNQPEETAKIVIDGWVHTGDRGYYDSEENIYVTGRYKELIMYRIRVVPENVEKHLMTHPAVEDAAVIGRPDDLDGELPTAFIVVRAGHSLTAEELLNYVDDRLADEEKLRGGVRFTGRIPRNGQAKIVRPELTKMILPV